MDWVLDKSSLPHVKEYTGTPLGDDEIRYCLTIFIHPKFKSIYLWAEGAGYLSRHKTYPLLIPNKRILKDCTNCLLIDNI